MLLSAVETAQCVVPHTKIVGGWEPKGIPFLVPRAPDGGRPRWENNTDGTPSASLAQNSFHGRIGEEDANDIARFYGEGGQLYQCERHN